VPSDTANVVWTQPEDNEIFTTFRDDVPASSSLFGAATTTTAKKTGPHGTVSRAATLSAAPSASPSSTPVSIQARTANQSICAG
jgi:hypothetical protein